MTFKDRRYVKINSVNPLHLIIGEIIEYFEEINENKYSTVVPTNENKRIIKKYNKIK